MFSNGPVAKAGTNNPIRMIDYAKASEIIDDCSRMGVKSIIFSGGGEPTVHPDHAALFKEASTKGLDCALITNAYILKDETLKNLEDFEWIRVSIEAATPETYTKIRRIGKRAHPTVLKNIERLVAGCKVVGLNYVVTLDNYHEIHEFARLASTLGVKHIRFSYMLGLEDDPYGDKKDYIYAAIQGAVVDFTTKDFKVFENVTNPPDTSRPTYKACHMQKLAIVIGADKNVYRCCALSYNERGLLGSLEDQTFEQMWYNDDTIKLIKDLNPRACEMCHVNSKNKILSQIINDDPIEHENFI
jgi:radical SAM protein with 4Fe4S-binding SPASM domain